MSGESATPTGEPAEACLNCGAPTVGSFCAHCGQKVGLSPRSIRSACSEVLGNVFSYDNRLWRSLVLLIVKPGFLAQAFHDGKRVAYMDPLRMFLLLGVLVFFAPDTWTLEEVTLPDAWTAPAAEGVGYLDRLSIGFERLGNLKQLPEQEISYLFDLALHRMLMPGMAFGILGMALVMRLLHRRSFLVDHLVFGLHFAGFICLVNLILRLLLPDIGNTTAEAVWMMVLQVYWLAVGYQVRYAKPGLLGRTRALLAAGIALFAFLQPYRMVMQWTLAQMLMPPAAA